ncbi:MAG TPA: DUF4422 domain-containing protein [Candidatus Gastranaerophilaceae bacterium]|nr:DUF4422 domain-containing protein [Candidatus Gastranaerophilaceae bacterium]
MPQAKPLISFILPNYNNEHVIDLFFEKFIKNNTYDNYEFIVVDDGSEDNGLELLYKWQNSGKINNMKVIAEPHKGIINALNKALDAVKGEFIIRMDGDATIESKSFVEKFLEFYYINPEKIGVITGRVMMDDDVLHSLGRSVISEQGLHDVGKKITSKIGKRKWDQAVVIRQDLQKIMNIPAEIDTALGVCTFCDTKTAKKIGKFDENYPLWLEDDDFYLTFRLHGKKCFYLPDIKICHRVSLRGNRNPDVWKNKKNFFKLIKKFIWSFEATKKGKIFKILGLPLIQIKGGSENRSSNSTVCFLNIPIFKCKPIYSWREKILLHDYTYWKQKWGFDPLNPDMNYIKENYKETQILWNYDKELKTEGEEILKKYSKTREKSHKIFENEKNIKILLSYHKPSVLLKNEILTPIHVGRAITKQPAKDGAFCENDLNWLFKNMIGDDTGENISDLNRQFCELTAQYWAWKNQDKINNPEYIGFMHYRRHFIFNEMTAKKKRPEFDLVIYNAINENYINEIGIDTQTIENYMGNADVIAYKPLRFKKNVKKQFKDLTGEDYDLSYKFFDLILNVLYKKYPNYKKYAKKYLKGYHHFWFNAFVMKKEIFDDYCQWLFDILFEAHKKIDYPKLSIKGQRVLGFLAERLHGIYLTRLIQEKKYRIKYAPLTFVKHTDLQEELKPAFNKNNIAICLSSDNNYVPYLSVVIKSIIENSSAKNNYDIMILEEDVTAENKSKICNMTNEYPNISIRFYNVCAFFNDAKRYYVHGSFKLPTYYRLYAASIFKNYSKIIYLDVDTTVLSDIAELYDTNLKGFLVAATRDLGVVSRHLAGYIDKNYFKEQLMLKNPIKEYFQAGVLVINIDEFKKQNTEDKLIKCATASRFNYVDQDVLNKICHGQVKYLPIEWNILTEEFERIQDFKSLPEEDYKYYKTGKENVKIIHHASQIKPWQDKTLDLAQYWWKYAEKTPFYKDFVSQNHHFKSKKEKTNLIKKVIKKIFS